MKINNLFLNLTLLIWLLFPVVYACGNQTPVQIVLKPQGTVLMTDSIQAAINKCAALGGGTVVFPQGQYLSGGLELKSNITLHLEKGAVLLGSDKYADYNAKHDAFIYGENIANIAITGEGTIDGVDTYNPNGEEGFRGPHCIRLIGCKYINFTGITIKNSANWAINCRYCSFGTVKNVTILAGHDGLHTRFCNNFTVTGCEFNTGDDAFAGNDNRDFVISDCKINTACNGFRMGCMNFTVQRCKIYGPGKYVHKIQKRNNMLSAFVHFSPKDDDSVIKSGNWLIKDVIIENVDRVYNYNFENGLWQTGQPVTNVRFENVKATGILSAFYIIGDTTRSFSLEIKNSLFSYRDGAVYNAIEFEGVKVLSHDLFYAKNFNEIKLRKVILKKKDTPPLNLNSGNLVDLTKVSYITNKHVDPYKFDKIAEVKNKN